MLNKLIAIIQSNWLKLQIKVLSWNPCNPLSWFPPIQKEDRTYHFIPRERRHVMSNKSVYNHLMGELEGYNEDDLKAEFGVSL